MSMDEPAGAVPTTPYVSKEVVASQRHAAAALAGGLIASGKSAFNATPEGAVQAYMAVFDELERISPSSAVI